MDSGGGVRETRPREPLARAARASRERIGSWSARLDGSSPRNRDRSLPRAPSPRANARRNPVDRVEAARKNAETPLDVGVRKRASASAASTYRGVGGAEVDADDLLGDDAQRHGLRGAAAHGGARLERLGVAGEAVDADRFLAEASHGSAADARRGGRDGLGAEDTVSVHRVWGETGALRWGVWRREGRVT